MELSDVNSKSNLGVTLGGIGLGVALLNSIHGGSFLSNIFGNSTNGIANAAASVMSGDSAPITRYEFNMAQEHTKELQAKDMEIAILKSEQNTEIKIADVYARLKGDMLTMERGQTAWNSQQSVNNATMSAAIASNAASIAALQDTCSKITKTIVPKDAICPEFMQRYNSWTAPTA